MFAAAIAVTCAIQAQAQTPDVTVPAETAEPTPNVSSGASNVVIPEAKAPVAPAAAEVAKPAVVKKAIADKPKAKVAKPETEEVVTSGTPAAKSEVLPWAAPPSAETAAATPDKPNKDGKDKKADAAAKVVLTCQEQAEDGCRAMPKCAWVADIAQPDGSRTPARCAEKTVFKPPSKDKKKTQAAVAKPKPDAIPDAPSGAAATQPQAAPAAPESPAKPAEKAADAVKPAAVPVTVSPPVEAVVKVPAATVPAVVPPVKPQ